MNNLYQRRFAECWTHIIEPSRSSWHAQVLVVKQGDKKRLVIDYSATINRFTRLQAHPFPRMESIVQQVAQDKFYCATL